MLKRPLNFLFLMLVLLSVLWRRDLSSFVRLSVSWRRRDSLTHWAPSTQRHLDSRCFRTQQMSVGSVFLGSGTPANACLLLSASRQLSCRCPSGWIIACGSGTAQRHQPCDKCFWFALTRTKCCHCYVKQLLRAFCRCAVRSHSAVALILHAFPQWLFLCAERFYIWCGANMQICLEEIRRAPAFQLLWPVGT